MSNPFDFNLRDRVRDTITGFEGVVISRTEWLNGCTRYTVQPTALKDGRPHDSDVFDGQQLELVEAAPVPAEKKKPTGGPQRDEKRPFQMPR